MFKRGDVVRPLNDTGEFVISRVAENTVFAVDEHEFEYEFLRSEIVLAPNNLLAKVDSTSIKSKYEGEKPKISKAHKNNKKKQWLEVDLHAGVLIGNTTGWSNHEILTEQLKIAQQTLKQARATGYNFCVFIHGKGKGRLKEELVKMLSQTERVDCYDADYRSYSGGATEVRLY